MELAQYRQCRDTKSDINEHIKTLREYASKCSFIVECGMFRPVSSWAFIQGLIDQIDDYKDDSDSDDFEGPRGPESNNLLNESRKHHSSGIDQLDSDSDQSDSDQSHPQDFQGPKGPEAENFKGETPMLMPWLSNQTISKGKDVKNTPPKNFNKKRLISCYRNSPVEMSTITKTCTQYGIGFQFVQGDSLKLDLQKYSSIDVQGTKKEGDRPDLIFIDTWHVYGQLKRELELFSQWSQKYIIMHDTTVDEIYGESLRERMDILKQHREIGFPIDEITKGLWPAIIEFLEKHPEWKLEKRYTNNNGLTILSRVS